MPNCGRNGFKLLARKPHLSGDYTVKFETAYDSNGKVNVHQDDQGSFPRRLDGDRVKLKGPPSGGPLLFGAGDAGGLRVVPPILRVVCG